MEYRFAHFRFDPAERRLLAHETPVDMSSRYLDVLALLMSDAGKLVTKDRFMDEVWAGVPVTDEALTQAIRSLRKALGDDASNPRFIETVPKHGYRFVGAIDRDASPTVAMPDRDTAPIVPLVVAGAAGGLVAGLLGGAAYSLTGGGNLLLVLIGLAGLLGLAGGGAIGAGIAIARRVGGAGVAVDVLGAAAGGLVIGAVARLFGIDAFTLLFGAAPTAMTGASEGLLLGAAVGGALHATTAKRWVAGLLSGGLAGALVTAAGGRLMAGSLALLDQTFPGGALALDWLAVFGPDGSMAGQVAITALEGALFVALVVAALVRGGTTLGGGGRPAE